MTGPRCAGVTQVAAGRHHRFSPRELRRTILTACRQSLRRGLSHRIRVGAREVAPCPCMSPRRTKPWRQALRFPFSRAKCKAGIAVENEFIFFAALPRVSSQKSWRKQHVGHTTILTTHWTKGRWSGRAAIAKVQAVLFPAGGYDVQTLDGIWIACRSLLVGSWCSGRERLRCRSASERQRQMCAQSSGGGGARGGRGGCHRRASCHRRSCRRPGCRRGRRKTLPGALPPERQWRLPS